MSKPAALTFFLITLSFFTTININPTSASASCKPIANKNLKWITTKITESDLASPRSISCDEYNFISSYTWNEVVLTTGRLKRKAVICLSNSQSDPCKHVIADFEPWIDNPPLALQEIFNLSRNQNQEMFETVERLFIKPSSLIK